MGLFDIFFKRDSLKEIKKLKSDIDDQVSRLEGLSKTLSTQLKEINQVPLNQIEEKIKTVLGFLRENEVKFQNTENSIETLKSIENGGEEFEEQINVATKNLGALNVVMEMELMDANSNLKVLNDYAYSITKPISEMALLMNEIPDFSSALVNLKEKIKVVEEDLESQSGKV